LYLQSSFFVFIVTDADLLVPVLFVKESADGILEVKKCTGNEIRREVTSAKNERSGAMGSADKTEVETRVDTDKTQIVAQTALIVVKCV
jgi:hypothetical protein